VKESGVRSQESGVGGVRELQNETATFQSADDDFWQNIKSRNKNVMSVIAGRTAAMLSR